jgi:two-component system, NtrC family, C4-dicarboxylate transport sensor histidine kinase DctB
VLLFVAICVPAAIGIFYLSASFYKNEEIRRAENRVSLYRSTLVGALERFQHLPFILSQDPYVIAAAGGGDRAGLSERLAEFAAQANLDAIYLMDPSGLTVAASNYGAPVTFLGQNYGFRPYFKDALQGKRGEFFGIGATTALPGYFIAERVLGPGGETLGVIAIKLDLSELARAWDAGGEAVFVSNSDGVVVLSSDESWRYKTLEPIGETRRDEIALERQFAGEELSALDWENPGSGQVELNGEKYVYAAAPVSRLGWTMNFLADESRVTERAWFTVAGVAVVATVLLALALFLRGERMRAALKISQADRYRLREANSKLALEIEERRAAERRLEKAQSELARNSKLAALGQLSASVTHELGQPISAIQNYLAAAEFDKSETERAETLGHLKGIIARMVNITKQLRFFARPADNISQQLDLRRVWEGTKILVMPDIETAGIACSVELSDTPVLVNANRLRLEQVLVNLVRNAIAAMQECSHPRLEIRIFREGDNGVLFVGDNGHGLGSNSIEQLKEPFHTTRASGSGMGLGLAISAAIVKEHEGVLVATNKEGAGAEFTVKIPLAGVGQT